MGVGVHLNIRLEEYDARIRTFIPAYEQMLDAAVDSLRPLQAQAPVIVDLGTGTGALAARCFRVIPAARVIAIDEDPAILDMARARLARHGEAASFVQASFLATAIPPCDAVIASLSLHHVHDADRKAAFYRECRAAINTGGWLVSADCFMSDPPAMHAEREAWRAHMRQTYSEREIDAYFEAWSREDRYFPLERELSWLQTAGFVAEPVWRLPPFAVVAARAS